MSTPVIREPSKRAHPKTFYESLSGLLEVKPRRGRVGGVKLKV